MAWHYFWACNVRVWVHCNHAPAVHGWTEERPLSFFSLATLSLHIKESWIKHTGKEISDELWVKGIARIKACSINARLQHIQLKPAHWLHFSKTKLDRIYLSPVPVTSQMACFEFFLAFILGLPQPHFVLVSWTLNPLVVISVTVLTDMHMCIFLWAGSFILLYPVMSMCLFLFLYCKMTPESVINIDILIVVLHRFM